MLPTQSSISGFFTRNDLSSATVIGQVDKKFIACLISTPTACESKLEGSNSTVWNEAATLDTSTLVLVDQHAADERIRVESFLKELCLGFLNSRNNDTDTARGVEVRTLTPPKPVLVTWHELQLLKESAEIQEAFRNWGIHLTVYLTPGVGTENPTGEGDKRYGQILVEAIPEIVSDKVMFLVIQSSGRLLKIFLKSQLLQEDELQNLVKGFLSQQQADCPSFSSLSSANQSQETDKEFLWLKALRFCPQPLLDLVNSKACRGTHAVGSFHKIHKS